MSNRFVKKRNFLLLNEDKQIFQRVRKYGHASVKDESRAKQRGVGSAWFLREKRSCSVGKLGYNAAITWSLEREPRTHSVDKSNTQNHFSSTIHESSDLTLIIVWHSLMQLDANSGTGNSRADANIQEQIWPYDREKEI